MRIVRDASELGEAVDAATREAEAAFGDGRVFFERYLERPRHVELQLLADVHGNVLVVGDRDCSVQRRHQKVIEEAPAPGLDPGLRARMSEAATAFAREIGYRNAGTAEFLVEGDEFFFLELNGRIQVEHPVTELVTGIDLVREQINIARGLSIGHLQCAVVGHAVEARLYAEDPRTFIPQGGKIERLDIPATIRVDSGVEEGDVVPTQYDPMLAKLIAYGATRDEARLRLLEALDRTRVAGVVTNLEFLRWVVRHPVFSATGATVNFLREHPPLSMPPAAPRSHAWHGGWRLNLPPAARHPVLHVAGGASDQDAHADSAVIAPMPGTIIAVHVEAGDGVEQDATLLVLSAMKMEHPVRAPRASQIEEVHVETGQSVSAGQVLIRLAERSA
jgi:acetyl/propionyl-CoA carboxylase alpha subunit